MQVDTFELVEWALSCRRRAQRKLVFGRLWALVASASVSSQQSISWWGWHHCLSVRPLIWKKSWTWSRESGNRVRLTGTSVAVPINSVTASDLQNKILLICFCLSDITQFFLVATISLNHMVYSRIWVSGKCSFNLVKVTLYKATTAPLWDKKLCGWKQWFDKLLGAKCKTLEAPAPRTIWDCYAAFRRRGAACGAIA